MSLLLKKLATPLILLAWATYYFIQVSGQNPQSQYLIRPVYYVLLAIFVVIAYGEYKGVKAETAGGAAPPSVDLKAQWERLKGNNVAIFMVSTGIYLLLMPYLGYIIATVAYLFTGFTALRSRMITAAVLSPALALAVYGVFKVLLGVPLPVGLLGI